MKSRESSDGRALMNCSTPVLDALSTRQILLGHAELLAALLKETQDKLLPVIIKESKPVAEVKKTIEQVACSLAAAIFEKADCAGCPHNLTTQGEMFGESIGTGNCTNRTCYNEKTLDATATSLHDEYPVVRIVRAGDNHTRVQLAIDGPKGIGEEQAKACHACQNFGAAVSSLPDSIGKVYRGQCFDTVCNMKKVAEHLQAAKAATQPKPAENAQAGKKDIKASGKAAPISASDAKVTGANSSVTVVSESDKIKAYRVALWRKTLRREVGADPALAQRYLVAIALSDQMRCVDQKMLSGIWEKLTQEQILLGGYEGRGRCNCCRRRTDGARRDRRDHRCDPGSRRAAPHASVQAPSPRSREALDALEFLELITKSEMMVVADELGIRAALGDNFKIKKVFCKPKSEVIDALLAVESFDYMGKIPKVLNF